MAEERSKKLTFIYIEIIVWFVLKNKELNEQLKTCMTSTRTSCPPYDSLITSIMIIGVPAEI